MRRLGFEILSIKASQVSGFLLKMEGRDSATKLSAHEMQDKKLIYKSYLIFFNSSEIESRYVFFDVS